jgi:hypothetical protein
MQAGAPLAPGIHEQAFKKETGIGVGCVIPARVTPPGEIPIDRAGFGDEVRKGCVKRAREVRPGFMLSHCMSEAKFVVPRFRGYART